MLPPPRACMWLCSPTIWHSGGRRACRLTATGRTTRGGCGWGRWRYGGATCGRVTQVGYHGGEKTVKHTVRRGAWPCACLSRLRQLIVQSVTRGTECRVFGGFHWAMPTMAKATAELDTPLTPAPPLRAATTQAQDGRAAWKVWQPRWRTEGVVRQPGQAGGHQVMWRTKGPQLVASICFYIRILRLSVIELYFRPTPSVPFFRPWVQSHPWMM